MEGPDVVQRAIVGHGTASSSTEVIFQYFTSEGNAEAFVRTLYSLIRQSGLVRGDHQAVRELASEIMNDVVAEALAHSDRYNPAYPLGPWLHGIAINMIKRKRDDLIKTRQREVFFAATSQTQDESSFDEVLERSPSLVAEGPERYVEVEEENGQLNDAFAHLRERDQQVLRLAIQYDLDYAKLAEVQGITQEAARQRYHRATTRLREIIQKQGEERDG